MRLMRTKMQSTMKKYRNLTKAEIEVMLANGCQAEDWKQVTVARGFEPQSCHRVTFYGWAKIGSTKGTVEVTDGFVKHCGINNATLRNVTIGDNCLIENIGNYINDVVIGNCCQVSNVSTINTTRGANYGEGTLISVLNEAGKGNLILFSGLNSQVAALMVNHAHNTRLMTTLKRLIAETVEASHPQCSTLGEHVAIVNTNEITNAVIGDACRIEGAARLSDCTIASTTDNPIHIGAGVICENSIVSGGSKLTGSVKMVDCFVGEACELSIGFTAASSVFFANCYMSNGEACAAFCGPYTVSHHKSSLLIGAMFSFYNAGSATNFSNHAYKMGPMHYGTLERGVKTASGAYLLMPAKIGAFSVLFGKLMYHPDTRDLPFSYLIAYSDTMYLVPGRNFATVGLYRDIRKWPQRDRRNSADRKSCVNFDWLSPFTISEVLRGKKILENLREHGPNDGDNYKYQDYIIKPEWLERGLMYYDLALRIYMGAVLKRHRPVKPSTTLGEGNWIDLSGLLMPEAVEQRVIDDIIEGKLDSISSLIYRFKGINDNYNELRWEWSYRLLLDYYELDELTDDSLDHIHADYIDARRKWIGLIRKDAEKEFALGDVEREVFEDFIGQLDREVDFEDRRLYM